MSFCESVESSNYLKLVHQIFIMQVIRSHNLRTRVGGFIIILGSSPNGAGTGGVVVLAFLLAEVLSHEWGGTSLIRG